MDTKKLDLEDERTAQRRYRRALNEKNRRSFLAEASRNNLWTRTGLPYDTPHESGTLVGRVALRRPNTEILDGHQDFYIGDRYAEFDGVYVFSWAAPVACTFFRGSRHHELCDEVAAIRTFEHQGDDIVDFQEERIGDELPASPFRKRPLTIPAAPQRRNAPRFPEPSRMTPPRPSVAARAATSAPPSALANGAALLATTDVPRVPAPRQPTSTDPAPRRASGSAQSSLRARRSC
ncbi:MAG TPA: hypothetical protein VIL44_12040 [Micromonospora sp.]